MNNIYTCQTCGMTATEKGHLCKPMIAEKVIACRLCGTITGDPRHVCAPKLVNLKYFCSSCGRLASKSDLLCRPKPIAKPKKPAKKSFDLGTIIKRGQLLPIIRKANRKAFGAKRKKKL